MKSGLKAMTTMFSRFESLGTKTMPNGAVLYGKAPHVGEQAWLHGLYSPCPEAGLATIEEEVDARLPASLRKLLLLANGLEIFSGVLSLYGWREDFKRTIEAVLSQPYSIVTPNTRERPEWLPRKSWIIGSYEDGTAVCLGNGGVVTACTADSGDVICEWKTLNAFLQGEAKRLPELFDEVGRELSDSESPLPGQ